MQDSSHMPTPDRDHDLLIRMLESQAEMKAMLKTALDRQDKADEAVKAIGDRVSALELREARQGGRAGVIATIWGSAAAGVVTVITMYVKDKLGL
jgi:hypothetical protein